MLMNPLTPILRPGPISKGIVNSARHGAAFELTDDIRECNKDIPSPPLTALVALAIGAGASGSEGAR